MKFEPPLQLPSIGELLDHPRVKGVVERFNRSTVAQRAAGFLEELRSTVVERAGKLEIPPIAHLAERLVRRLLGEPGGCGPAINATGVVLGEPTLAPPLCDAALHAMLQQGGDFHDRGERLRAAAAQELCQITGAEAALIVGSVDAALAIGLASVAANREALVAGHVDANQAGIDWRRIAAYAGVVLRGASDQAAFTEQSRSIAAVVRAPDAAAWLPLSAAAETARAAQAPFLDVAPVAGLWNPQVCGMASVDAIGERIAAGADLVVVDGAGLLGGPACGLLLGRRRLVTEAANLPLARLALLDPLNAAALLATIQIYRTEEQEAKLTIPLWQLLSAPIANLQQRAERLAPLLAALPGVESAEAMACESTWLRLGDMHLAGPDWAIDVRPKHGDAAKLLAALAAADRPVIATEEAGAVRFSLRSVFPRWDQQLLTEVERSTE